MKQFMPELSEKDRVMIMQENAAKIEDTTYQKALNEDDLSERREQLAETCIAIDEFDDDLKAAKEFHKSQTKPLKSQNRQLLSEIKTKQVTAKGILYYMANHEDSMMEVYDNEGNLVSSRRLKPDEKQAGLFSLKKAM